MLLTFHRVHLQTYGLMAKRGKNTGIFASGGIPIGNLLLDRPMCRSAHRKISVGLLFWGAIKGVGEKRGEMRLH